ncbi:hypothetical protein NSE01_40320 [Novosphingobium sediminis]|uniref:GIY-YIG domain-containing protein n=2 Tax=Novosphingobium sediminis TaxID=707214 RepID=A0A512AR58_9SPHN|nr:hypothetical protein NSE01_40320 [Novosphingobium sediminis]
MEMDAWRRQALESLERAARSLETVEMLGETSVNFRLSDIVSPDRASEIVTSLRRRCTAPALAIYCFELVDPSGYPELRASYARKPASCDSTGQKLSYSRLHEDAYPGAIYVGSSKSVVSRFSQHLGLTGGSGTSAMRLKQWAAQHPFEIRTMVWFFAPDLDPQTLLLLEQALWDYKRPLLGKRSGH